VRCTYPLLAALAAIVLVLAPAAHADQDVNYSVAQLSDAKVGSSKSELRAQVRHSLNVVEFFQTGDGYWQARLMSCHPITGELWGPCKTARNLVLAHTWLADVASQRLDRIVAAEKRAAAKKAAKAKAAAEAAQAQQWLVDAFMCIHSHEGSWTDDGAPYWGGLQFGWSEWQRFGGMYAAQANYATPEQQIQAGINYWRVSGFNPWPNTARMCGLL
jgi:hypothetical protein